MYLLILFAFAFCFSVLVVVCVRKTTEARVGITKQPCVSDEEFCELLPEVPDEVALRVRDVLVDATGWDSDEIHPDTKLVEFELS